MADNALPRRQKSPTATLDATKEAWRRLEEAVKIPSHSVWGGEDTASSAAYVNNIKSYIEDKMQKMGVPDDMLHVVEIDTPYDDETRKPQKTLMVRLGPKGPGGLMFCGHADVVSAARQEGWETEPYKPEIKVIDGEERMYGRGTIDMKGGIEAAIQTMLSAAENVTDLKKPVYLAITHSEELGCLGAGDFQKAVAKMEIESQSKVLPESVIVSEPTASDVLFAHKGGTGYAISIQGNKDANAFDYATQLTLKIHAIQDHIIKSKATHDDIFDPPYAVVNVGILDYNPVKNSANMEVYLRLTPKAGFKAIDKLVRKAVAEVTHDMERNNTPSSVILDNAPLVSYELKFTGVGGHSAFPDNGINAAIYLSKAVQEIQQVRKDNFDVGVHFSETKGIGNAGNAIPGSGTLYLTLQGDKARTDEVWQEIQEKLHHIKCDMHEEYNKKNYQHKAGGKELLPDVPGFGINITEVPSISPLNAARTKGTTSIAMRHDERLEKPLLPKADQSGVDNINRILGKALGRNVRKGTGSFVTDAGFISTMLPDATVVVYGPGNLLGQGGHGVNEYMERKQMAEAIKGNNALVDALCFQKTPSLGR